MKPEHVLLQLLAFIEARNAVSPWVQHQLPDDWRKYINAEFDEFDQAATSEQIDKELGDLLILVLSMIAHYGVPDLVFEYALEKMRNRAPYVLTDRSVTLADELRMWNEGKARENS